MFPQPFRFLDLSAELRNSIYACAIESHPHHPDTFSLFQFLSLTQISQQIRREFRPMYMAQNDVYFDDDGLTGYLDAFLPGWSDADIPETVRHSVVNVHADDLRLWIKQKIDLLTLLRLCAFAPGVKIVFTNENSIEDQQVGQLLQYGNAWAEIFENDVVKKLALLCGEGTLESGPRSEFHIVLRENYQDLWEIETGLMDLERTKRLMEELGFDEEMCEEIGGCFSVWLGREYVEGGEGDGLEKVMGLG